MPAPSAVTPRRVELSSALVRPFFIGALAALAAASPAAAKKPRPELGGGCRGTSFTLAPRSPFPVGGHPRFLGIGDLNRDGKPDIVTADGDTNALTIALGDGTGAFTPAAGSPVPAGLNPTNVAIGDLNRDGKPDLAVGNFSTFNGAVKILLGDGNGGFTSGPAITFPEGTNPTWVATADLNRDGKLDLAVTNENNTVTILLGTGTGAFSPAGAPIPAGDRPGMVAIADLNGDDKLDLAVTNPFVDKVTIFLGDGSGGFSQAPGSPISVAGRPGQIAIGDVNMDGRPDLAVSNSQLNKVTILLGAGTGAFSPAAGSPYSVGVLPSAVAIGDLNLDGRPDVVVSNFSNDSATVLLGDGAGGFAEADGSPVRASNRPVSVAIADVDLDGRLDLAFVGNQLHEVTVLLNTCNASRCVDAAFGPAKAFGVGKSARNVAIGDLNRDGKPDLVVPSEENNNVSVLLGDGSGDFAHAPGSPISVGDRASFVAIGDINRDGKLDLVVARPFSFDGLLILFGDGNGGFPTSANVAGSGPIAIGDLNRDGKPDLACTKLGKLAILLGDGNGGFSEAPGSQIPTGPNTAIAIGDLNRDGKPDLAVTNYTTSKVATLLGDGNGGFSNGPRSPFGVVASPLSVAIGDLNRDGRPDLAVVGLTTGKATVLLGDEDLAFVEGPGSPTPAASTTIALAIGDMNLDGKPDVAIANGNVVNPSVVVLIGDGTGGLSKKGNNPLPGRPFLAFVATGDLNRDGRPDVVVATFDDQVFVLLNTCGPGLPNR